MTVSVVETDLSVRSLPRRLPFHFGGVKATAGPQILLTLTATVDGQTATGQSMGALAPMWFYKDPSMSLSSGIESMLSVFSRVADTAEQLSAPTVFDFWLRLYESIEDWAQPRSYPALLWGFGVSLLEQAVIDAYCRATGLSFVESVHENTLGIDLGAIYPELADSDPAHLLPDEPMRTMAVRHTVGSSDPLDDADLEPHERLADGRPQTLDEYVRTDGVTHFKIKLGANDRDRRRLGRIHEVLSAGPIDDYHVTLDANEGYDSAADFAAQYRRLRADPSVAPLLDRVQYVEQPLARATAFTDDTRRTFAEWDDRPPVIIDESDDSLTSLATALDVGYDGTSHKNCKGVFNGLANRCLLEHRHRQQGVDFVMSGEDLTTLGPIEREQDLAVMATLGMAHVERNGHHYYRGLSAFDDAVQQAALENHPSLYERHEDGFVTLAIRDGTVQLDSVLAAPFGRTVSLDPATCTPAERWSADSIVEQAD